MKMIQLTKGKFALVDDADYEELVTVKWHVGPNGYPSRTLPKNNEQRRSTEFMHRRIMGLPRTDKREVDHKDGDKLNNQRSNLRVCTHAENCKNRARPNRNNTSGFKGIFPDGIKWRAHIRTDGIRKNLGTFETAEEAHAAYCKAADELFGEFANYASTS